jgi:membrane protease YdiL (CAAX protease family)
MRTADVFAKIQQASSGNKIKQMPSKSIDRVTLLNLTILVEAALLLAATVWSQLVGIPLMKALVIDYKIVLIGLGCGLAMALLGFGMFAVTRNMAAFSQLREVIENHLIPMLSDLKPFDLVVLAVLSGFCEEVFFRGVIQPQFGLPLTALAFAILHDPTLRNISYSMIIFSYGLVLGAIYLFTGGNLWAPIIAHTTHNLISLYLLRYRIKPPASSVQG